MMWRSVLCVPGHDYRKIAKCRSYGADLILFDLEDGVPDDRKPDALRLVTASLTPADAVRVCHPSHPLFGSQLVALDAAGCGILWVPKVEEGGDVRAVFGPWSIVALIETPRGVRHLDVIADLGPAALAFGAADFAASVGSARAAGLMDHARAEVSMVAHAAGVPCIAAPCFTLDRSALLREIDGDVSLGYSGKGCVHPSQIADCNERFKSVASVRRPRTAGGVVRDGDRVIGPPMLALEEGPWAHV